MKWFLYNKDLILIPELILITIYINHHINIVELAASYALQIYCRDMLKTTIFLKTDGI